MAVRGRLLWQVARSTGRTAAREAGAAVGADPHRIRRSARLDPHWRRRDAGGAARLSSDELIVPAAGIGRWHGVDPHRPHDGWRSPWKLLGLLGWGGAVGAAWWLGSTRSRGPLAGVAELDRLGEALSGFDRVE
ncbi:MAG: hypothetical protein WD638_05995 [Nitriliruptoraceae bacterium]